jgi:hypothetical protein
LWNVQKVTAFSKKTELRADAVQDFFFGVDANTHRISGAAS